jgi:hypothetical protein
METMGLPLSGGCKRANEFGDVMPTHDQEIAATELFINRYA